MLVTSRRRTAMLFVVASESLSRSDLGEGLVGDECFRRGSAQLPCDGDPRRGFLGALSESLIGEALMALSHSHVITFPNVRDGDESPCGGQCVSSRAGTVTRVVPSASQGSRE